ncbi:MAG: EamA family transporter, partial [Actinomycetota bacterium]
RVDASVPLWFAVAWVIVLGTVVPYLLFIIGATRIGPGAASVVGMAEPIVASFVAWILLGQVLSPVEFAGVVLAVVAITYVERLRMRGRRPQDEAVPVEV